jgi:hypothetical protein
MPYDVKANFRATLPLGTTQDQVREALSSLITGYGYGGRLLDRDDPTAERACWFDGQEVGVRFEGRVSWDFQEMFDLAADKIAELSSEAFETEHISDTTMNDRESRRVVGPNPDTVRHFILQQQFAEIARISAKMELPAMGGVPRDQAARMSESTQLCIVSSESDSGSAQLVASVNLAVPYLTAEQRAQIVTHFETLGKLLNSFAPAPLTLVASGYVPKEISLSYLDMALAAIGPGDWKEGEGATTGEGVEMWFYQDDGATAYVRMDQGKFSSCEISRPEARPAQVERPRTSP